ncbi:MAG: Ig-like domain-containing protein, partial [Clostridia bacterium]|nr:Ig-like domain-containing protein [Clostridia bacterium]
AYRAKIEKNSYYIYFDEEGVLESGTKYQITVPGTVANIDGEQLEQGRKFTITMAGSKPKPVVGSIAAVDKDKNPVTDINNVPLNLWAIQIPFGCTLDPATANTDTVTFKDENGNVIAYRAKIEKNSYYIYLDEEGVLESGTQYQITVPATVANTAGDELGQEFKFKFKTTDATSDSMRISSVKVNNEAVESLSDITAGSDVVVAVENNSGDTLTGVAMMVFRKNNKIVKVLMSEQQVETGTEEQDVFAFEVPSDMSEIDEVSVLLWNDLEEIVPYCSKVSITE